MKTSIIITSYNYGQYVERCIRSCMNQQLVEGTNEIVVVDDASTDNTRDILRKFQRFPNVHVVTNKTNVGVAESANIGVREAVGQYVVRVDADDYIGEWFVFMLRTFLEGNHDAFGVGCDYLKVDEHENVIERCSASVSPISCGIMYRRDLLVQAGLYNPDFRHCEEEELRRRVGEYYRIICLPLPLYRYRMHSANKTKQPEYREFRDSFRGRGEE
ncbi:MAG: glycosyltransferase [Sandaracinaceae bacterium]|nr:glycosyltransferase [Sandaracinaceae bacterium]